MIRVRNWDVLLLEWAEGVRGLPYRWGETDCGSLVREACRIMYGRDLFGRSVRRYRSLRGAARALRESGGVEAVLHAAGAVEVSAAFAQQGDVAISEGPDTNGMAGARVIVAGRMLCAVPEDGVELRPIEPDECARLLRLPNG